VSLWSVVTALATRMFLYALLLITVLWTFTTVMFTVCGPRMPLP
jgi:hypothetical protein